MSCQLTTLTQETSGSVPLAAANANRRGHVLYQRYIILSIYYDVGIAQGEKLWKKRQRTTHTVCAHFSPKKKCVKFLPTLYKLCAQHLPLCLVRDTPTASTRILASQISHSLICTHSTLSNTPTPPSTQIELENNSGHVHSQLCIHAFTALHSQLCSEDRLRRQH